MLAYSLSAPASLHLLLPASVLRKQKKKNFFLPAVLPQCRPFAIDFFFISLHPFTLPLTLFVPD